MNTWYCGALAKIEEAKRKKKARADKARSLVGMGQLRASMRPTDKKLDKIWSEVVRDRDRQKYGPLCRYGCGRVGVVAAHVVPKQFGHWIRWDLTNGMLACTNCNLGEVLNRTKYRMRHVDMFGSKMIDGLERKARLGRGHPVERGVVYMILTAELRKLKERKIEDRRDDKAVPPRAGGPAPGLASGDGQPGEHNPHGHRGLLGDVEKAGGEDDGPDQQ